MFGKNRLMPARTASLLLGLGLAGVAIGAVQAGSGAENFRCEIRTNDANGMITLEAAVHANVVTPGAYRFRASSVGHSGTNIQQGGNFEAKPEAPATLGRVVLGNPGAIYEASLEATSNGKTIACFERIGGTL